MTDELSPEEIAEMDAEELAVRVADIDDFRLTRPILRDRVEEIVQENLQYRQAFREYGATDINSNTVQFPVPDDSMGQPKVVEEGSEFPRDQETYSKATLTFDKFGFEVSITDEAVRFGRVDAEAEAQAEMARAQMKNIDVRAFDFLDTNNNSTTIGNDTEDLDFEAVVAAYEELYAEEYNPNEMELYVGPDGMRDLSLDDSFNRATTGGDDLVTTEGTNYLGEIYNVPVFSTNTGDLGDDEAILVDTSKYGYFAEWEPMNVETYREESNDQTVYQLSAHNGFAVTDSSAAVFIQGGSSGA